MIRSLTKLLGAESSGMRGHASREVQFDLLDQRTLTAPMKNVTITTMKGDSESEVEIQPHLNSGLWPIYLEMCDMLFEQPPRDGTEQAPGNAPQTPNVPT